MEDIDEKEHDWEQLSEELDKQFPHCPFTISCVNELAELDTIFSDEPVVFIYDNWSEYVSGDMQWSNYLKVESIDDRPSSLRQFLHSMCNDRHYNDKIVMEDSHHFLEQFIKSRKSTIQYTCYWGS